MKPTHVPDDKCPCCNHEINAATGITTDEGPAEGDVSVCLYCVNFLVYDKNLKHCALSLEDYAALPLETRNGLQEARRTILITCPDGPGEEDGPWAKGYAERAGEPDEL